MHSPPVGTLIHVVSMPASQNWIPFCHRILLVSLCFLMSLMFSSMAVSPALSPSTHPHFGGTVCHYIVCEDFV